MAKRYRVSGPLRAYDTNPGGLTPPLDPDDPLVQVNITAGIIHDPGGQKSEPKAAAPTMACPLCKESGVKKPAALTADKVADHYADQHAGFAVPAFTPDSEEE
jgi:hypothetical protein